MFKPIVKPPGNSAGGGFSVGRLMKVEMQCQSQWCWAAVSYSLVRYHGLTRFSSQQDLAKNILLNDDIGLSAADFIAVNCGRDNTGRADIPRNRLPFDGIGLSGSRQIERAHLTESDLQSELSNGRPVPMVIRWNDDRGGFHAIVVVGGKLGAGGVIRYFVEDPYEQNPPDHTFADLLGNYGNRTRSAGRVTDAWFVEPPVISTPVA